LSKDNNKVFRIHGIIRTSDDAILIFIIIYPYPVHLKEKGRFVKVFQHCSPCAIVGGKFDPIFPSQWPFFFPVEPFSSIFLSVTPGLGENLPEQRCSPRKIFPVIRYGLIAVFVEIE
jgi:hypothetical protein